MASSSCSRPFSLFSDVQHVLGPPSLVNKAVRRTFPSLFNGSTEAMLRVLPAGLYPAMVTVRPGHLVPSGTVVGLFAGHMFAGPDLRGDHYVAMPPIPTRGGQPRLAVNAAAPLAWFPSATQAGLYYHDCEVGTLTAEWRTLAHDPPLPSWWRSRTAASTNASNSRGTSTSTASRAPTP
jgi:hypothetical protein